MKIEKAKSVWSYDPETGVVSWNAREGAVAGSKNSNGYIIIQFEGRAYKAHRLAWMIFHGTVPNGDVDHINGDRTDNRISNLRVVSRSVNMRNARRPSNNTSGVTGVYWDKSKGCWRSLIKVHGKSMNLGHFDRFDDAVDARKTAEVRHGFHENHGRH